MPSKKLQIPFYKFSYGRWDPLDDPKFGFMNTFSECIKHVEAKHPNVLPNLRQGPMIFVGSDYSGQHRLSNYESLTLLFVDLSQCGYWEKARIELRQKYLPDGRRMSYKNLNDIKRKEALPAFLESANSIYGLLAVILIDKRIKSLFTYNGRLQLDGPELKQYVHWNSAVFNKLLTVVHFVSCFLSGLSKPYQDILWITDEDDIVANEQRLREFVSIFGIVSSHYLKHTLGHIRIGTTMPDTGRRDIEDFVSVADLAGGALCDVLTDYQERGIMLSRNA